MAQHSRPQISELDAQWSATRIGVGIVYWEFRNYAVGWPGAAANSGLRTCNVWRDYIQQHFFFSNRYVKREKQAAANDCKNPGALRAYNNESLPGI
jgi:hypothetical protein